MVLLGILRHVIIRFGTRFATVTQEGWLDVKTHTPDKCFSKEYPDAQSGAKIVTPLLEKQ